MIGCVRARASSHARILRPPPVRSLPGSWIVRFGSTHDGPKGSNSQGTNNDTGSSVDGSADNSIPSPSEFHAYPKVDSPSIAAPPTEVVGGTEPWSVAQDALPDVSSSVTPSIADAAVYMLTGALNTGGRIMDAVQSGVQGIHAATGLPWWATIAVVTVGVKISLLPVVVYQARHMDRVRMAWPEIQMLRAHLASTLEQIPRRRLLARWRKYSVFFPGVRGVLGLHGAHPLGMFATPLVNMPVFIMFVWSIRSMLRDKTVAGLDTGGMLWFVDLTVSDSSLMLPVVGTLCTYGGLELAKMKNATGWIKFFQNGMQTFMILMLPWISTFPQGVFMYWIPSSLFTSCQTLAIRNNSVRHFLGLQPLGGPPATPPGGAASVPSITDSGLSQEKQALLAGGVIPGRNALGAKAEP